MSELSPACAEIVRHYRKNAFRYAQIADAMSIPRFPRDLLDHLSVVLGNLAHAELVESVTRLHNYGNAADFADLRSATSKLLFTRGVKLPRGKRTKPALEALVGDLTPLLLHLGLPLASSERSRMIVVLRMIAEHTEVAGDPRDEVRRLVKIARKSAHNARDVVLTAMARGLAPLDVYSLHEYPPP